MPYLTDSTSIVALDTLFPLTSATCTSSETLSFEPNTLYIPVDASEDGLARMVYNFSSNQPSPMIILSVPLTVALTQNFT